ncbi:MAG: hypothetical protein COW24_00125 [Candidatus Kerfeldbacteria bacterium CG15_BIG_FIL_POST_REV_8_21_14_020_45_12]|uniref:EamA domain-containing protein n=1 Tax=Candidatus Kerfeldbacteria bacterium CG15_BIG_FIL_POST_REV_8_21_14_020_45_12 TaxID=2014247 RepID=A0A2M7H5D2_9BACT|nr:MAG: hypothetical protein COW24_00125 [Candidatus Kerfeldbacteria bacterium CG15_BIG_FIL_POST_REV_8_21_14_020_45_12]PJA92903.1 MAG: hypothetical protein CO132_05930 [Candidatus Kerfeldbacteria bacterium CG_4_9_14_3_um_filter_45_8]
MDKVPAWFFLSLTALAAWGFWGFFPKITTTYLNPKSALVWESLGAAIFGLIILTVINFSPDTNTRGVALGILTGMCGMAGALAFLYAVSKGKASVVVTMTALYPLLVILLSYIFLHETINLKQAVGIAFAMVAMVLFVI